MYVECLIGKAGRSDYMSINSSNSLPRVEQGYIASSSNVNEASVKDNTANSVIEKVGLSRLADIANAFKSLGGRTSLNTHTCKESNDQALNSRTLDAFITANPLQEPEKPIDQIKQQKPDANNQSSAKGIKKLKDQIDKGESVETKASFPKEEKDFREYDKEKSNVPGQKIIDTKKRGVEPGFVAKKIWTESDKAKLLDPNHKFHKEAVKYLMENDERTEDKTEAQVSKELLKAIRHNSSTYKTVRDYLTSEKSGITKFQKKHYWKLDYAESIGKDTVAIDAVQAKGNVFTAAIHRKNTKESRREKNLGGAMEVLANDIFNVLGFGGQKLSLRLGQYSDGHPKFLVDGTHVQGDNGEKFQTINDSKALLQGPETQGRIEGNMLPDPDNPGKFVPMNEEKWGSGLLKSLLLADRDKLGAKGDNLGYIVVENPDGTREAIPKNIDPGKSFEDPSFGLDRMMAVDDIRSDCTFEHRVGLADKMLGGYKNYSIFSDTTLADKMQGMKDINEKWPEVLQTFQEYIEFFKKNEASLDPPELRKKGDVAIHEYIQSQLERLKTRKANFDKVFGNRVNLDRAQLTLLDNVEKLTSLTTNKAEVKKNGKHEEITLKHLAVVDPKVNRKEWSFVGDNGLMFTPKDKKEHDQVMALLKYHTQLKDNIENARNLQILDNIHPDNPLVIFLNFPKDKLGNILEIFSEKSIAAGKGQKLLENVQKTQSPPRSRLLSAEYLSENSSYTDSENP